MLRADALRPVIGHDAGATGSRITLNVPDRTAALFGDQAVRDAFKQALNDAGRLDSQRLSLFFNLRAVAVLLRAVAVRKP